MTRLPPSGPFWRRCPDEIHVARASLIDDPDLEPAAHVFTDQRVAWLAPAADELPELGSDSEALSHYRAIPPAS